MSEFPVALSLEPRKYSIGKMAKMNDSRNSSRRDSELLDQDANVTVTMNTPQPKMESPRHMAQNGDQKYRNWTKSTKNSSGSLVSTSAKTKHFSDSKLINPCTLATYIMFLNLLSEVSMSTRYLFRWAKLNTRHLNRTWGIWNLLLFCLRFLSHLLVFISLSSDCIKLLTVGVTEIMWMIRFLRVTISCVTTCYFNQLFFSRQYAFNMPLIFRSVASSLCTTVVAQSWQKYLRHSPVPNHLQILMSRRRQ